MLDDLRHNWTVQRQKEYSFSSISCDQTIEQTCNRDSKTKGGIIGFTTNRGAVDRWILSSADRCTITKQCQIMSGVAAENRWELF